MSLDFFCWPIIPAIEVVSRCLSSFTRLFPMSIDDWCASTCWHSVVVIVFENAFDCFEIRRRIKETVFDYISEIEKKKQS